MDHGLLTIWKQTLWAVGNNTLMLLSVLQIFCSALTWVVKIHDGDSCSEMSDL